jgi:AcrR family transcriptional regulator
MMIVIASTSRQKMIESAALLFREQGYSGTGFRDVIEHSGAPRGSIYHHFPGGKAELAAETVRYAGDVVATRVGRTAGGGDPAAALHAYLEWWVRTLEGTGFRAGCPVIAVAVEAQAEPAVTEAAAEAFERWESLFAASLRQAGVAPARASRLATLTVAAIEGAVVLCRAERSTQPLMDVGKELEAAINSAQAR